jgi:hypothetical protein
MDVFCAWGDGPDVGLNFSRTEEEAARWKDPHLHFFWDLTADQADELAERLRACADQARRLNEEYIRYCEENEPREDDHDFGVSHVKRS